MPIEQNNEEQEVPLGPGWEAQIDPGLEPEFLPDNFFEDAGEDDEEPIPIEEDGPQNIVHDHLAQAVNGFLEENIKELTKKTINQNIRLHKGGIANSADCIQTKCGRWFLKDDKDVRTDIIDGKPTWLGVSIPLVGSFLEDGQPNRVTYEFTSEHNLDKLTSIMFDITVDDKTVQASEWSLYDLIPKDKYTECYLDGKFYHNNSKIPKSIKKPVRYRKTNAIKRASYYTPKEGKVELPTPLQFKYGLSSPSFNRTEGKRYSFGVELETISGYLPPHLDKELNYEAVHDGSLKDPKTGEVYGAEYVTGVLIGDTGFLQLKRLETELRRRCKIDKRCGMHVHIGNINFNKQTIVYAYKLFQMLENEIFSMMPPSRRNNEYCRSLKKIPLNFVESDFSNAIEYDLLIEEYHNKIIEFLASSNLSPKVSKKFDHPFGHKCGYKHETARYCWINFIPAVFNTRKNGIYTIEFRNHGGTLSYEKTKYWILICMGLMWFIENHFKEIALNKNISLKYIMNKAYPKQGDKINQYIDKRVLKFNDNPDVSVINEHLEYEASEEDESLSIKTI